MSFSFIRHCTLVMLFVFIFLQIAEADGRSRRRRRKKRERIRYYYVIAPKTLMRSKPERKGELIASLGLLTRVRYLNKRKRRWLMMQRGEDTGWVQSKFLRRRKPTYARLISRGKRHYWRKRYEQALFFFTAATKSLRHRRKALVWMARTYDKQKNKDQVKELEARIKKHDSWVLGSWCDGLQNIEIVLDEQGNFKMKKPGKDNVLAGKYFMDEKELTFVHRDGSNELFKIYIREVGYVLIDKTHREYLKDFCQKK